MTAPKLDLTPVDFTPKVAAIIRERAGGRCEGCGLYGPTRLQYRSRGGRGTVANGIALCGLGNASGCYQIAHAGYRGESVGWSIRTGCDPLLVPVFCRNDSTWWRHDDDGGKEQIHPIDAVEYMTLIHAIREGMAR